MSIIAEIQETINNSEGQDTVQLNLSEIQIGKFTPQIKKTIEQCKNLEVLILVNCGLTSLDNLPDSGLIAIDLTDNKLNDSQLSKLTKYKDLGQIIFNQNNITKLDSIKSLSALQNLQQIDFSENPVTNEKGYTDFVWNLLPKLEILDRHDRQGNLQVEEQQLIGDSDSQDDDEERDDDQQGDDDDEQGQDDDEQEEESQQPQKKRK